MRFAHRSSFVPLAAMALLGIAPASALACSSCGCTLATDWLAQSAEGGFHADFRFDYFNQDQLRSGTGKVDRGGIAFPADREIQQVTINRNYNLFLDYAPGGDWGVSAQIPYSNRYHTTVVAGDEDVSTSHAKAIGDVRLLGRYRSLVADRAVGVQLGVKLGTGRFHDNFVSGPQAGEPLDRGLQPGTGTTDLLVGLSTFGAVSGDWDYFAEALLQQPLNSREGFRPGTGLNLTLGARYTSLDRVRPQIQLNMRTERRGSGLEADGGESGGARADLHPRGNPEAYGGAGGYAVGPI